MNIFVVIRAVRNPASFVVNRKAQKVFVNRQDFMLNPADRNALEAALQLTGAAGSVTVAAVGGAAADECLRQCLALGASRAIWVKDSALARSDALVAVNVLQRLIEYAGGADLVLCGDAVLDADLAQVGARLAAALGWPFLGHTHQLVLEAAALTAIVRQGHEFHRQQAKLPAVASVARDSNKPRYAPGARLISIFREPGALQVVSTADLGLNESELAPASEARGESFPPELELGQRPEGDLNSTARLAAELIRHA